MKVRVSPRRLALEAGSRLALVIVAITVVAFLAIRAGFGIVFPSPVGPTLEATVRVERIVGGRHWKWGGSYRYEVVFPAGERGTVVLHDTYSTGTRLRLRYQRDDRGGFVVRSCRVESQSAGEPAR